MTFTEQLPLAFGASGPAVAELQRRLREAGYPTGDDASAQLGAGTQAAVRRFQADHGIPATGIVNDDTWQRVVEAEFQLGQRLLCLVSPMMRGNDVAELQLRLGSMGFDAGRVDGIFGPATQLAVRDFQRNAGLVCDDVCGPDTVQALQRLEGRGGRSTVAGVRERERLRQLRDGLAELRLAVAASAATQAVAVALATTIESVGGATMVLI
ncbi:MAG: peptidoglycan-binding domain-containing protein, partial [Actinomycetes bacterium]